MDLHAIKVQKQLLNKLIILKIYWLSLECNIMKITLFNIMEKSIK